MKCAPFFLCACCCLSLHAKDFADYRVGDIADADVITPVPLEVVDAAATAALQSARATQFPAVFRSLPQATNALAAEFLAAFDEAKTNFIAGLAAEFHSTQLDATAVASPDFSRFVTAFDVEHKNFPVADELAAAWASGKGAQFREQLLAKLQAAQARCLCPEEPPKSVVIGQSIRLVPVAGMDEKLSFDAVQQAPLVNASNLTTVAGAQAQLRGEFPASQQLFARALAAWLRPNCYFDAPFTQLTRGTAVCQLTVSVHFDAGDAIVRQGAPVDAKIKAALAALREKLAATPPVAPAVAVAPAVLPAPVVKRPVAAPGTLRPANPPAAVVAPQLALRHKSLIIALSATSALALFVAIWQFLKQRKSAAAAPPPPEPLTLLGAADPNVPPQVAQAVREAVQQELASQRRELLLAQQAAAAEIAALVQRLDTLQMPMQERLHTYETRIQSLEKELAVRNEENRELLKLKIEMISRQLETERAGTVMTVTAA